MLERRSKKDKKVNSDRKIGRKGEEGREVLVEKIRGRGGKQRHRF